LVPGPRRWPRGGENARAHHRAAVETWNVVVAARAAVVVAEAWLLHISKANRRLRARRARGGPMTVRDDLTTTPDGGFGVRHQTVELLKPKESDVEFGAEPLPS
jgi:hypothetical protein